jgi:hypothetical protein
MSQKTYLLRVSRTSQSAVRAVGTNPGSSLESHHAWFWNDYALSAEGDLTVQAANRAASWLIAGERLAANRSHQFRRVIMAELREGEPFDIDGPTWTLCPPAFTAPPSTNPLYPPPVFGLRPASPAATPTGSMLSNHTMLRFDANRRRGATWKVYLAGSVGSDDVEGTAGATERRPGRDYALGLAAEGTAAEFVAPWVLWCWEQVPELDTRCDVSREGVLSIPSQKFGDDPELSQITHFSKMARWQLRKSPAMRKYDDLRAKSDALITRALRWHGDGDTSRAWLRSWQFASPFWGELLFHECALLWRDYSQLLGFSAPQGMREHSLVFFTPYSGLSYMYDTSSGGYHGSWAHPARTVPYTPPSPPSPRLNVTRNRPELLELCSRLLSASEWYYSNRGQVHLLNGHIQWTHAADGTPAQNVVAPVAEPYPYIRFWVKQTGPQSFQNAPPGMTEEEMAAQGYYPIFGYQSDNTPLAIRQQYQLNYSRYQELSDWAFGIIDALNWLEILIYPEKERAWITKRTDMVQHVPRVPPVPDYSRDTEPSSITVTPYTMHHRHKRGPWIHRPSAPPPVNEVSIQTPPAPALTAIEIKARGDLKRKTAADLAAWKARRDYGRKIAANWEDVFPSRGEVPKYSPRIPMLPGTERNWYLFDHL